MTEVQPAGRNAARDDTAVADLGGRVVVLAGTQSDLVAGIARALTRAGAHLDRLDGVDLTDRTAVNAAFAATVAAHGRLDALVFAHLPAAAAKPVLMADMTDQHFGAVWEDTMQAMIACLQGAYVHFAGQQPQGGRVVAVVPALATSGGPGYSATAAMAEGQRLLIKSVARQWGPENVRANTVMVATSVGLPGAPDFEFSLAERALGRVGDAENDIGAAVTALCTSAAQFITGSTLFCDGGLWMSAP